MSPPRKEPGAQYGVRLTRYLEQVWNEQGTTRGAWCRQHGIADSTVLRWSMGVDPDLRNYRAVAKALNLDLEQILRIAGEIESKKGAKKLSPLPPRHVCRLDVALAEDNSVRPEWRKVLRQLLNELNRIELPRPRRTSSAKAEDPPARVAAAGRRGR